MKEREEEREVREEGEKEGEGEERGLEKVRRWLQAAGWVRSFV